MFFHIANIEREVYWQIGNVCCSAYPIEQLDSINSSTGELNTQSALNLIVFGVRVPFINNVGSCMAVDKSIKISKKKEKNIGYYFSLFLILEFGLFRKNRTKYPKNHPDLLKETKFLNLVFFFHHI